MKTTLDYKKDFLCVLTESEISDGPRGAVLVREWHPVHAAEEAEVRTLVGRPVTEVNSDEGIYIDEEGNVFQLAEKGRSKPMEVEQSAWEREPAGSRRPDFSQWPDAERGQTVGGSRERQSRRQSQKRTDTEQKRQSVTRPAPNLPMASAPTSMTAQQENIRASQRQCSRS